MIEKLFTEGKRVMNKNLMVRIMGGDNAYMVTVSSKNFKRAVDRNRIKRLLREVIRGSEIKGTFALIYVGKGLPNLETLRKEYNDLVSKL